MSITTKEWMIEWSDEQQTTHVDKTELRVKRNLEAVIEKRKVGYVPIAFANTIKEASEIASALEKKLKKQ